MIKPENSISFNSVNKAFSKQSASYDEGDRKNIVLQNMREQVYRHIDQFLKPSSKILELNAGTGIDAARFCASGHSVSATDLSDGMITQIKNKIALNNFDNRFTCEQLSYDALHKLADNKFDFVFSNFGGLNCIDDLSKVTRYLPQLLHPGAFVTWVIMPPIYLWELAGLLKGNVKGSLRRLNKNGVKAHLEGEYFKTYYHSVRDIKRSFGSSFSLVKVEGLQVFNCPPHRGDIPDKYPKLYNTLRKIDSVFNETFPFNYCGDHVIVTFRYDQS